MARISGLERINRYPSHNKDILKRIFGIEPKRGKLKPIIDFINQISYRLIMQETASKYTVSDFFSKSTEVFSFISNSLIFLDAHIQHRPSSKIHIDNHGFSNYEGISLVFLNKHKDLILFELNQTDLI